MNKPTEKQINDVLNICSEQEMEGGTKYQGMTYEQGVAAGIKWVKGYDETAPLD